MPDTAKLTSPCRSGSDVKATRNARYDAWAREEPSLQGRLLGDSKKKDRKASTRDAIRDFDNTWQRKT